MTYMQCLLWDDDEDELNRLGPVIERVWNSNGRRINLKITAKSLRRNEMIDYLKNSAQDFQIFVTDLYQEDPTNPGRGDPGVGGELIRVAKEIHEDLVIVALTQLEKAHRSLAIEAGADFVVKKGNLLGMRTEPQYEIDFGRDLEQYCIEKNAFPPIAKISLTWNASDLRLKAIVSTIGEEQLIHFAGDLFFPLSKSHDGLGGQLSTLISAKANYIRPGYSGAYIISIDCETELEGTSDPRKKSLTWLILKISRNKIELEEELKKREMVVQLLPSMFVDFFGFDRIIERGGWYCLGARMETDVDTFSQKLISGGARGDVEKMLSSIFLAPGMHKAHVDDVQEKRRALGVLRDTLGPSTRANIQISVDELEKICQTYVAPNKKEFETVTGFLFDGANLGSIPAESIHESIDICSSHGDLHGANILVSESGEVKFIDPANFDQWPWMVDIARLSVSIIVSCLDYGPASYGWEEFNDWLELCDGLIYYDDKHIIKSPDGSSDNTRRNQRVTAALIWIRNNLDTIHPGFIRKQLEWQFRLGLALEFMRCGYRFASLTAPKRTLGLVAAGRAILAAELAYKQKMG